MSRRWGLFATAVSAAATVSAALIGACHTTSALAADIWSNSSGDRLWSSASNWSDGTVPTSADDVIFPTPVPAPSQSNMPLLSASELAQSLTFNAPYTLLPNVTNSSLSLASGLVTVANAQFPTIAVNLNGGAGLSVQGGAGSALILTTTNTYTGGTTIVGGTLQIGKGGSAGTIPGDVANSGTIAFNRSDNITFTGVISGSGTLTKLASNTLTLSGKNAYTGVTTVSAGTLQVGGGSGSTSGAIAGNAALGNNTILIFSRADNVTYAGVISGGGQTVKEGNSTLTLTGNCTATGTTFVNSGTLQVGDGGTSGALASSTVTVTTKLVFNRSNDNTFAGVISSGGQVVKLGSNTLTFTNNSRYAGPTTISAGTLQLGNGGISGFIDGNVVDNAALKFNQNNQPRTFIFSISGTGTLIKAGINTLTLTSNNNSYTGGTIILAGVLQLGQGQPGGMITGDVANSATLAFNRSDNITFGGVISGSGVVSKFASGTLTLAGSSTYTGTTNVSAGTLIWQKSFTTGSTLSIQDGATARLAPSIVTPNDVVLRATSLNTSTSGMLDLGDNKLIVATGDIGAAGTGTTYSGLTGLIQRGRNGGAWNGAGGIVTSQTLAAAGNFVTLGIARAGDVRPEPNTATTLWAGQTITGTDVLVMYTYGGDATLDGKINIDDYIKIDSGIAAGLTGWSNGDFNYDGKVNIDDYTQFIDANIGTQGAPFPTAASIGDLNGGNVTAVPEPSTITLGTIGAVAFAPRQRRKTRNARGLSVR